MFRTDLVGDNSPDKITRKLRAGPVSINSPGRIIRNLEQTMPAKICQRHLLEILGKSPPSSLPRPGSGRW